MSLKAEVTHREDLQRVPPQVVPIASLHIMYADQQTIIHHVDLLQQLSVPPNLLRQQGSFLRAQFESPAAMYPIQVLQHCSGVDRSPLLWVLSSDRTSLEVVRLVDITMRWEEVVHDDEVDLPAVGHLDTMKTVEPRQQRVRVGLHVCMVLLQHLAKELVLAVMEGLDDEPVVPREIEERAGFAGRPQFREDVFAGERDEVI